MNYAQYKNCCIIRLNHCFEEVYVIWINWSSHDPLWSISSCTDVVWISTEVCVFLLIVGETDIKSKSKIGGVRNGGCFNKVTVVGAGDLGIACVLAVVAKVCNHYKSLYMWLINIGASSLVLSVWYRSSSVFLTVIVTACIICLFPPADLWTHRSISFCYAFSFCFCRYRQIN